MPLTASTWLANLPVTAGQLNQDMYTYDGSYFASNGVFFHSNRPICMETFAVQTSVNTATNGAWTKWGGAESQGLQVIDTSALFGIGCDSPGTGAFYRSQGVTAVGSSGVAGQRGGWTLMISYPVIGGFSALAKSALGGGWYVGTAPSVNDVGTIQQGSPLRDNASYACNLFNVTTAPSYYYPASLVADPSTTHSFTAVSNSTNSSGETPRFLQIWCGVNSNGATVSSVPSPQTAFTSTTPITHTLMNNTVQGVLNLLSYPPMLNCAAYLTTSVNNTTATIAPFTTGSALVDNYNGFSASTHTYTVPLPGVYFCHANIIFAGTISTGSCAAGFFVTPSGGSQVTWWGGNYPVTTNTAVQNGCPVTRMLDLTTGDKIAPFGYLNGQAGSFGTAYHSHFIMVWMGALAPQSTNFSGVWTPPDVSGFMFMAGTTPGTGAGDLVPVFNSKIANDLNFLLNKPYFLGQQRTSQTGLTSSTTTNKWNTVTIDTPGGQIHTAGTVFDGDNYNGWVTGANNRYVAPVNGWYLVVSEMGITPVAGTNSGIAGINCPSSGGLGPGTLSNSPPDWYQHMQLVTSPGPSAPTAVGLYYLAAGEYVQPQVNFQPSNTATTTFSTDVTSFNSTFSVMWVSN